MFLAFASSNSDSQSDTLGNFDWSQQCQPRRESSVYTNSLLLQYKFYIKYYKIIKIVYCIVLKIDKYEIVQ